MGGTKGFKVYQYDINDSHDKGITMLQAYYKEKITTSTKESYKAVWEKVLFRLQAIKDNHYYTTQEQVWLNNLRDKYLIEKKVAMEYDMSKDFRYV